MNLLYKKNGVCRVINKDAIGLIKDKLIKNGFTISTLTDISITISWPNLDK